MPRMPAPPHSSDVPPPPLTDADRMAYARELIDKAQDWLMKHDDREGNSPEVDEALQLIMWASDALAGDR